MTPRPLLTARERKAALRNVGMAFGVWIVIGLVVAVLKCAGV